VKSPRSQNSRNKVHSKNTGFTVCELGCVVGYDWVILWVGSVAYVCGLGWVVGYEMHDFQLKMHHRAFGSRAPSEPAVEFTALSQPSADLEGWAPRVEGKERKKRRDDKEKGRDIPFSKEVTATDWPRHYYFYSYYYSYCVALYCDRRVHLRRRHIWSINACSTNATSASATSLSILIIRTAAAAETETCT